MEGKEFFTNKEIRDLHRQRKCQASKDDVEIDEHVGIHDTRKSVSLYDKVRKNWAEKFSSIENQKLTSNKSSTGLTGNSTNSRLSIGWALTKGRTGGVRFSENVRRYLIGLKKKKPIQKRSNVKCAMPEMNGMKDCFKKRSGSPRPK